MNRKLFGIFLILSEILFFNLNLQVNLILPLLAFFSLLNLSGFRFQICPATFPSLLFLSIGVVGYIESTYKNSTLGTSIGFLLPPEYRGITLGIFCLASSSLCLGNLFTMKRNFHRPPPIKFDSVASISYIPMITALPAALMLSGFRVIDFLHRSDHLLEVERPLVARLGSATSLIAVLVLGVWTSQQRSILFALGIIEIAIYSVIFFSSSSRSLISIPVAIFLIARRKLNSRLLIIPILTLPLFIYYAILIPLYLRAQSQHGLFPYLNSLAKLKRDSVSSQEVFQNASVAFDLNGLAAFSLPKFPIRDLGIEISPLLGKQAGWYEISSYHRFNPSTPAAAIGETMNYGIFYLIVSFFCVGATFGYLNQKCETFPGSLKTVAISFTYASSSYFSILCLQYNLRSAIRIVYYCVALVFIFSILLRFRDNSNKSKVSYS